MRGSKYTLFFAFTISLTLSVLLSGLYMSLKDKQDANRKLDQQTNILEAAQIFPSNPEEALTLYQNNVIPMVIDKNGNQVPDKTISEVTSDEYLELYKIKDPQTDTTKGYVYPIVGSGLWSTLYGYLAVDKKGQNILGITFYKQGETPGLGAEIEKKWFKDNFIGKSLYQKGKFVGVKVAKGAAQLDPEYNSRKTSIVNGISGATITTTGVTEMTSHIPKLYENFFIKKRGKSQ